MTTLANLYAELDALNETMNDETDDLPQILAEQERLFAAIAAAEAADLTALSAKELVAHFQRRAPDQTLPKGISKAALVARITKLPPLVAPEPTPSPGPAAEPEAFSVAAYAKAHGLDARELRKRLRGSGLRAPYTLEQVLKAVSV